MDVFAKPTSAELIVRNPRTGKRLDPAGETVPRSGYWLRRESDGDVELSATAKPAAPKAKPTQKEA